MAKTKKNKLRGTKRADELMGTLDHDKVLGKGGDDLIETFEGDDVVKGGKGNDTITPGVGMDKVWGGKGDDLFVTENGGEGHMKIMDFARGDRVQFCGCASTVIEQRGDDAWIIKGDDVKAVLKGVSAEDLDLDFTSKMVSMVADPLA
tara:strand:- start:82 stop:525 length:444 start_codon:yes stop_codon:yes gene_type:complete